MNFRVSRRACLLLVLIVALSTNDALARKWTDSTGTFSVDADFVDLVGGVVALKQPDGRLIRLPLERLSAADQQHVRSLAVPMTAPRADAAGTVRNEPRPSESPKLISDAETQVVIAEGVGTNAEDALREAFRQAVRQVVGTFVDAETLVKNDELVSDKILTYSNGYITAYKKLRENERNGLVRVTIQAAVKREPLAVKLSEVNVTVAPLPGSKLFAQAVSQTTAEKDARALLRSALVGFPHNLIEASSEGEPKIEERSEESVTISYKVKVAVNIDKYTPFQQRLTQVLERIAKEKGETTLIQSTDVRLTGDYQRSLQGWGRYTFGTSITEPFWTQAGSRAAEPELPSFEAAGRFSGPLWPGYGRSWQDQSLTVPLDVKSDFVFVVNTGRTRMHDRTTWKWYCVPRAAVATADEFKRFGDAVYEGGNHEVCPDQAKIQVEFLDRNKVGVAADEVFMSKSAPGSMLYRTNYVEEITWAISPYIVSSNVYAQGVTIARRLELPLRTLAEIESVRCTVTGPQISQSPVSATAPPEVRKR